MANTHWQPRARRASTQALGWGIIGASQIAASRFILTLRRLANPAPGEPHAPNRVLGIFSHNEQRAALFAQEHAISHVYLNLSDMLARPDIHCVYIGSHPRHHAQAALAALAAGKHVFCEPPLALNMEEAETVSHTALSRGLLLGINYTRRADPALLALRQMVADQEIGDLVGGRISHTQLLPARQQSWRLRRPGGGVLLNHFQQSIDIVRYLLRTEIAGLSSVEGTRILADGAAQDVEEDVATTLTLRQNGCVLQLHDSFIVPHTPTSVELYGSLGTLIARHCWDAHVPSQLWLHRHGQATAIELPEADAFSATVQRFMAALDSQKSPFAGGADAVHALRLVQAAADSLASGRAVQLTPLQRPLVDRSVT